VQRGTITFRVVQPLIATVESWGVVPTPTMVALDTAGSFTVTLMASSDLDLFPSGFRYNVQERFQNGYLRTYEIELPASSSPLELPSASQYDPGDTGLAIVHSINGRTGIVQLTPTDLGAIPLSQKAAANGVASLDATGKLVASQMPAPTAGVASVDGRSGTVILSDLYAALGHTHTFPVTSVNGSTGAVTLTAASVSAIPAAEKGAANGVARLDATSHLMLYQFPEEAWVNVFDAASQAAMLALAANRSDLCRRTDLGETFILIGNDPSVLADWKAFLHPAPPVTSVNTETGAVVLSAADVGAVAAVDRGAANGVASLDATTKVPAAQIPNLDASKITTGLIDFLRIPTGATGTTVSAGDHTHAYVPLVSVGVANGVASLDSTGRIPLGQIPPGVGGVNSVNGLTGVVTLTAAQVGALATTARGALNGVAALDGSGFVPTTQIPNLDGSKITSGLVDVNRLPTGTASNQVSLGNHTHASYIPMSDRGIASGVATLDTAVKVPLDQLPTGTTNTTVARGDHTHGTYIPTSEKGVASGVATLDGTGLIPVSQIPDIVPVDSVNGMTGAVTLTAANVSALAITTRGAANGVASLDATTKVPIAELPTGTTASHVAVGNHGHGAIKAIQTYYVTTGNVTGLANTANSWTEVDSTKFRRTITAAAGDVVFIHFNMTLDPIASHHFDVAFLVGSTPVRYLATNTGTPAAGGNPTFQHSPGTYVTTGLAHWCVLDAGDVSGGLLTVTFMYSSNAVGGTVWSSDPATIITLVNHGPATV
jgi:hypothetical protein